MTLPHTTLFIFSSSPLSFCKFCSPFIVERDSLFNIEVLSLLHIVEKCRNVEKELVYVYTRQKKLKYMKKIVKNF